MSISTQQIKIKLSQRRKDIENERKKTLKNETNIEIKFETNPIEIYKKDREDFFKSIETFFGDYETYETINCYAFQKDDWSNSAGLRQMIQAFDEFCDEAIKTNKLLSKCYESVEGLLKRATEILKVKNLAFCLRIFSSLLQKRLPKVLEQEKEIKQIQESKDIPLSTKEKEDFEVKIKTLTEENTKLKQQVVKVDEIEKTLSLFKIQWEKEKSEKEDLKNEIKLLEGKLQSQIHFEDSKIVEAIKLDYKNGLYENAANSAKGMYESRENKALYKPLYWLCLVASNLKLLDKVNEFNSLYWKIVEEKDPKNSEKLVRELSDFFDKIINARTSEDKKKGLAKTFESFFEAKVVPDVKSSCEEKYKNIKNGMSIDDANKIFNKPLKDEEIVSDGTINGHGNTNYRF